MSWFDFIGCLELFVFGACLGYLCLLIWYVWVWLFCDFGWCVCVVLASVAFV